MHGSSGSFFLFPFHQYKGVLDLEDRVRRGREGKREVEDLQYQHLNSIRRPSQVRWWRSAQGRRRAVQRRSGRSVGVEDDGSDADGSASMAVAVSLPAAPAPPLDRLGFRECGWGCWRRGEPRYQCPGPSPLFILALYSGGPPTIKGWAPPIRARIKVGLLGRRSIQHSPPWSHFLF